MEQYKNTCDDCAIFDIDHIPEKINESLLTPFNTIEKETYDQYLFYYCTACPLIDGDSQQAVYLSLKYLQDGFIEKIHKINTHPFISMSVLVKKYSECDYLFEK